MRWAGQRRRGFQPQHGVAGVRLQRGLGFLVGHQAPALRKRARQRHWEAAYQGHGHAMVQACQQPLFQRAEACLRQVARKAQHNASVAVGENRFRQRLLGVGVVHRVAQVVERHLQKAVCVRVIERWGLGGVVHHQNAPRHRLDASHAHAGQIGIADPGREPVGQDFLGRSARQCPVMRRHIVDHQHWQALALAHLQQLAAQPGAVGLGDFFVAALCGVPAPVEGLGRHHLDHALQLRHDLEASVQDEPDAGKALVQCAHELHQPLLLCLFVKALGQPVRIQRIQKKAPKALRPQWRNHPRGKKIGPAGGGLVDDFRSPGAVAPDLPGGWNVGEIGPRRLHLGHRGIGIESRAFPGGQRLLAVMVRIDHHDIKRAKVRQAGAFAVVERDRRFGPCCQGQAQAGRQP